MALWSMDDDVLQPSFFHVLFAAGPCELLTVVVSLLLTGWLIVMRVRRCWWGASESFLK